MNPQDMDKMASQVEALFYELQNRTMADIVRRIQKMDKITATADLQINRLLELGNTSEFIESELLRTTGASNAKIWELYDKVVEDQYTANRDVYEQINGNFVPYPENEMLQSWYNAAVSQNQDEILNITKSLGFYIPMGAGKKVFSPLSEVYTKYLNAAAMDVLTGSQSYNTVLRRVSKELSHSGMQWVDYASGYHYRATTAARRAVLTGVNQMSAKINEQTAEELGTETFEVTWHSGARPTHWWGGNIYTKQQLRSICGLGEVDGLCGANCRHAYHAFIPGISVRTYSPEQLEQLNAKERETHSWKGKQYNAYEATAKQREMERTMRAQRSNIVSLKQGGADHEDILVAQSRYLGTLDEYKRFSKEMGLQPDLERVYVDRLGRVVSGYRQPKYLQQDQAAFISKRSGAKNAYTVNRKNVNCKAYHDKYENLPLNKHVCESAYKEARRLLTLADGTFTEYMIAIDARTGDRICDNLDKLGGKLKTGFTKAQYEKITQCENGIVLLHNHPDGTRPSGKDIITIVDDNVKTSLVTGHDGSLYAILSADKTVAKEYMEVYNEYRKTVDEDSAKTLATGFLYRENERKKYFEVRGL